eukprot:12940054-Alexandrium_andersonii.AAC.1
MGSRDRQPTLLDPREVRRGGGRGARRANPELTGRRRPGGVTRQVDVTAHGSGSGQGEAAGPVGLDAPTERPEALLR